MGFFDVLNSGVDSFFKELAKSKRLQEARRENQFDELDHTPFLFSSSYLLELSEDATKEEYESILDHMYRHNATEVDSYRNVEKEIIKRLW